MQSAPCTMMKTKNDADDINDEAMSNAQQAYLESNNSKKHLFLMCFGLTDGGTPVFDPATEPWNTIRKRDIKATRVKYANKVIRHTGGDCSHKTANWSLTKCILWLEQHPLTDKHDILFKKARYNGSRQSS
jgi:hypothetical protein